MIWKWDSAVSVRTGLIFKLAASDGAIDVIEPETDGKEYLIGIYFEGTQDVKRIVCSTNTSNNYDAVEHKKNKQNLEERDTYLNQQGTWGFDFDFHEDIYLITS